MPGAAGAGGGSGRAGVQPGPRDGRQLAAIEILASNGPAPASMLGFVHPLVRAAVYERLSPVERLDGHARAAQLLAEAGATAEKVVAHLLAVSPAGDIGVVATLRRAAHEVFLRGTPEAAVTYRERCLKEPPPSEQ